MKNKNRNLYRVVKIDPYGSKVYVVKPKIGIQKAKELYRQLGLKPGQAENFIEDDARAVTFLTEGGGSFIYFDRKADWVIVHEACHAIFNAFKNCGIPINQTNDEAFCYALDRLYTSIKKALKELK